MIVKLGILDLIVLMSFSARELKACGVNKSKIFAEAISVIGRMLISFLIAATSASEAACPA